MDRNLRKILTECIRDIETGAADVGGCIERHPDWAAELRAHLSLTRFSLRTASPVMNHEPASVPTTLATTPPRRRTLGWTLPRQQLATG